MDPIINYSFKCQVWMSTRSWEALLLLNMPARISVGSLFTRQIIRWNSVWFIPIEIPQGSWLLPRSELIKLPGDIFRPWDKTQMEVHIGLNKQLQIKPTNYLIIMLYLLPWWNSHNFYFSFHPLLFSVLHFHIFLFLFKSCTHTHSQWFKRLNINVTVFKG